MDGNPIRMKAHFEDLKQQKNYVSKYNKYIFNNRMIKGGSTKMRYLYFNDRDGADENMFRISTNVVNQIDFLNTVSYDSINSQLARVNDEDESIVIYEPMQGWEVVGRNRMYGEYIDDVSGYSISMSKDTDRVAIGGYKSNGNDRSINNAGNVTIFDFNDSDANWYQVGNHIYGLQPGDHSGNSISISDDGSRIAIGSYLSDGNDGMKTDCGSTRIYDYNSNLNNWNIVGNIIYGEQAQDESGSSVSLSGDGTTVAIGSPNFNNGSGHTRIFSLTNDNIWEQKGDNINYNVSDAKSGSSVAINKNGNRVVIGNPCGIKTITTERNYSYSLQTGDVRAYEYNDTNNKWVKMGNDLDGASSLNFYGSSVAMNSNGDVIAVGGHGSNTNGFESGYTQVFNYNENTKSWNQLGNDIIGEAEGDQSGWVVSLNAAGDKLAISAPLNHETDYGHVRAYNYESFSNKWFKLGRDLDGKYTGQLLGYSVCLNGAGNRLAVSSPFITNQDGFKLDESNPYISDDYGNAQVYNLIEFI